MEEVDLLAQSPNALNILPSGHDLIENPALLPKQIIC